MPFKSFATLDTVLPNPKDGTAMKAAISEVGAHISAFCAAALLYSTAVFCSKRCK